MNCVSCLSIWLRPVDPSWIDEGTNVWTRRFQCGGCGGVFVIRVTKIGQGATDREKNQAHHNPAPKVMLADGNGGTKP